MARFSYFLLVAVVLLFGAVPSQSSSAAGGGAGGTGKAAGSLSAEIRDRIRTINARPLARGPAAGHGDGNASGAMDSFLSSLSLEDIDLNPEELRNLGEARKSMESAGLPAADLERALKMMEAQMKMSRKGKGSLLQAMARAGARGAAGTTRNGPAAGNGASGFGAAGGEGASIEDSPLSAVADGYGALEGKEKARWALNLADHMAVAVFYDMVDGSMLKTAGLAVSAYPHPLLLNNYAAMLRGVSAMDSLFFFFAAEALEPRNPVILANIAMAFLDVNDFGAARNYATQALAENPEFGPAFQVLTICHLKDGNSVLAAETLMKSARDCFDDLSVRLFEDYLQEVGELDVTQGEEYPLPEDQLEILYEIARKYGDPERHNPGVDVPDAQIRIAPFPDFGSADNSLNSMDFLLGDAERRANRLMKLSGDITRLEKAVLGGDGNRGTLPVVKNMRQYYAYLVLESYYGFKMRELNWKLQEEDSEQSLEKEYVEAYLVKCAPFRKQEHDLNEAFLMQGRGTPREEAEWYRKGIRFYTACIGHQKELLDITRKYAIEYLKYPKKKYDERKRLVEEFWLKAGGLMKYMTVQDVYDLADRRRESFAVDRMDVWPTAGYLVPNMAGHPESSRATDEAPLGMSSPYLCTISPPGLQGALENIRRCEEELAELGRGLNSLNPPPKALPKYAFDADPVEIERTALPMFEEAGDLPLIGFEGTIPFSDKHTAYTDGEKSTWIMSGEEGARGAIYDESSGTMTTFDVKPKSERAVYDKNTGEPRQGSSSVFDVGAKLTDGKELGDRLDSATDFVREKVFKNTSGRESEGGNPFASVFKGAEILKKGQETIGFLQAAANVKTAGSRSFGEYVTRDRNHRVIDHGLVYIRQVGGALPFENVPELGREVMVMKSRITGVSTKQEFTQYKFKFATVRTR